jgi:hypothetical protein
MKPPAPAAWLPKTKAEKALHLSLFPPISNTTGGNATIESTMKSS